MMEDLGRALIADCAAICNDPQYQRSCHVRSLRAAIKQFANEIKRLKKAEVDLATSIQACATLEQTLNTGKDLDLYKCNQDQVTSLHSAAEAIMAAEEIRSFMAERNKAALDASMLLFGSKGVIPKVQPEVNRIPSAQPRPEAGKKVFSDGWQPRWAGDVGDNFEPYQQLVEQYLHSAISYHTKALEHLSSAFAAVTRARTNARDSAYLRTLASAAGVSVKDYQKLLEMFRKIDIDNTGTICKRELMAAMKRDKDIAAFMQLSRAKGKDGKRESFESVFNRIDSSGAGAITWESFLKFFSSDRSLVEPETVTIQPPIMSRTPVPVPQSN
eukprot:Gb_33975 [translate_table: standard]